MSILIVSGRWKSPDISPFLHYFYARPLHFNPFFIRLRASYTHKSNPPEVPVSVGVITGIVLVVLLLGYLIYALLNAEAF